MSQSENIYDAAEAIAKEHRLCPLAPIELLDDEGIVHPDVGFIGFVEATDDPTDGQNRWRFDPTAFRGSARGEERSAKDKSHLYAYSTAEMLAAHSEIAIPTLAEYDEERVYYESLPRPYWLDGIDGPHMATRNLRDPI